MVQLVPEPDPLTLLPPLLASLPASFASSRPPPSLLPLLSPILRQRVHIHTTSTSNPHESWLRLLCWDSTKADRLKDVVENARFEPHPSSGEIEVGDTEITSYKRFDIETLKTHLLLFEWDLSAVYLWCTGTDDGDGWKLAELLPFDSDLSHDPTWSFSINEAEEKFKDESLRQRAQSSNSTSMGGLTVPGGDEDDYWAMYDGTPGRTPARKLSTIPAGTNVTEEDYYARYGDVQPALDSHDPDEAVNEVGQTSVNGNALQEMVASNLTARKVSEGGRDRHLPLHDEEEEDSAPPVRQPTPSSPRSRAGSDTVEKLESKAERYAASEIGIRHHIGYSVKSLYRLAKSAGVSRQEFEDMVQRELDTLSILDRNN